MSQTTLELAKALIACPSITPNDAGCQAILSARLQAAGFTVTDLPFGEVKNLWATHGTGAPFILFQGHTDVVPPGPLDHWQHDPFTPIEKDGKLYGRGASDMKSGLAAMAQAAIDYCQQNPNHPGTIAFAATSDEEGPAKNGMAKVVQWIQQQNIQVDYCTTGEPTTDRIFGDTLKIGRRGSLHGTITFEGKQGHIAYPDLAVNPIHLAMQSIHQLATTVWYNGYKAFQPTSLQFYDIQAGAGATNVIPGELTARCNFRYAPCHSADDLIQRVHAILDQGPLPYRSEWSVGAEPFLSPVDPSNKPSLIHAISEAIKQHTGTETQLSTSGGTSDSRFFAKLGCEIVDFGPSNATAHQVNECIDISELDGCYQIYLQTLTNLLEK